MHENGRSWALTPSTGAGQHNWMLFNLQKCFLGKKVTLRGAQPCRSRLRWPWHWYIQGRQWTPLQRAEWCAALCRTFPASAGRPAEGEFTSMAASGAAWSGSLFKTLLQNDFAPPQTQASAAQCSHKLRSLSPSSRPAPLSGKASSLSASSGSLSKGFLIPLSAGDGQSLLCGRSRIDASLATRWRTS